ncbi:hypothetical protein WJX77_011696 [Trebouxia sp. C0004]
MAPFLLQGTCVCFSGQIRSLGYFSVSVQELGQANPTQGIVSELLPSHELRMLGSVMVLSARALVTGPKTMNLCNDPTV